MPEAAYPITFMCDLLGVARSSFYAWRNRVETPTQARRRELAEHVKRVFDQLRQTFGCGRIAAQLNREGHECSVGLVADLMRELGLKAVSAARLQAHYGAGRAAGRWCSMRSCGNRAKARRHRQASAPAPHHDGAAGH